jgi:hypothetical protein
VDRHVVHALLGLVLDHVEEQSLGRDVARVLPPSSSNASGTIGTVPMGTGRGVDDRLRGCASMFPPVERSITVSAP